MHRDTRKRRGTGSPGPGWLWNISGSVSYIYYIYGISIIFMVLMVICHSSIGMYFIALIIDGNSERFVTSLDLIKCLKQIETCSLYAHLSDRLE